jgi:hypothetical protein
MLFLARIEVYDMNGIPKTTMTNIFFSPLAMLLAVSLASSGILFFIVIGVFKRYPSDAPLAGCCSASISVACQPGRQDQKAFHTNLGLRKLRWGVAEESVMEGGAGHATFSDGKVKKLVRGMYYA